MGPLVYLDVCCFKRPFDDQRQERVRLEAAAVAALITHAERGTLRLVRSPAHVIENDRNPREDRRLATAIWLAGAIVQAPLNDTVRQRSRELASRGFGAVDALHVAFAEEAGADWLVTVDDQLEAAAQRIEPGLRVRVANPRAALAQLERS